MSSKHEIRLTSVTGTTSQLMIGGKDVSNNVTGLTLEIARNGPQLTLDIIALPLDIHMLQMPVRINEGTHDLLVQLGWTPPPEEGLNDSMD